MSIDDGNTNEQQITNRYLRSLVRQILSLDPQKRLLESIKFLEDHEKLASAIRILLESHLLKSLDVGHSIKLDGYSKNEVYILTRKK